MIRQNVIQNRGRYLIAEDFEGVNGSNSGTVQNFYGEMVDFHLYNASPPVEWMVNYTKCLEVTKVFESIQDFGEYYGSLSTIGKVTAISMKHKDICSSKFTLIIPHKMTFTEAEEICKNWKGKLVEPKTQEEANQIVFDFVTFEPKCSSYWTSFLWIGYKGNPEKEQWEALSDQSVLQRTDFFATYYDKPSAGFECLSGGLLGYEPIFRQTPCNRDPCPVCIFDQVVTAKLRGICKENREIDRQYYLREYQDEHFIFRGFHLSYIFFSKGKWIFRDKKYGRNIGTLSGSPNTLAPLGVNKWKISVSECERSRKVIQNIEIFIC